jgi:endoglucanase
MSSSAAVRFRRRRLRRSPCWRSPQWSLATSVIALVAAALSVALLWPQTANTNWRNADPFSGIALFVDPHGPAAQAEASLSRTDPPAAALLRKITTHPVGIWLGAWIPASEVAAAVRTVMREAVASDSMPLFVLYAFPRDGCATGGGEPGAAAYERWVGQVVRGIGGGRAAVIVEPDALAQYIRLPCLSSAEQRDRLALIRRAVDQLARSPETAVYLDAGNSHWQPAKVMAPLLLAAGVQEVRGFSLNVSNFDSTAAEEAYGDVLSAMLHGAHYVIDTSRNGTATATTWCNPPGQALGVPPTASTGNHRVDALLWIKPPWASDGPCNGGRPAGMFWLPYALDLAAHAQW